MDIKHTKGPWKVVRPMKGKYRGDFAIVPQSKHSTESSGPAFCYLAKGREDMQEANAKLIAAAPALLDVLNDIVRSEWTTVSLQAMTPQHRARLERARAAIGKATGEA